jgi:hypothetical protein
MSGTAGVPMSKADMFWQYAKETVLAAYDAETNDEREGLFDLAGTWTQAALLERASSVDQNNTVGAA